MTGLLIGSITQAQGGSEKVLTPLNLLCFKEVDQVLTAYKITINADTLSHTQEQSKKETSSYSGQYFAIVSTWDAKSNRTSYLYSGLKQFAIKKINPYVYYFYSPALKVELVCNLYQKNTVND